MLNPILTILLILTVITIDVYVNWYIIEVKRIRPNHLVFWLIRAVIGSTLAYKESSLGWVSESVAICFIYWFLFDLLLNIARQKPFNYLGDPIIDRLQKKYLHSFPAFIWKAMIAFFCCYLILSNYFSYL